jgi:hypothetical protein
MTCVVVAVAALLLLGGCGKKISVTTNPYAQMQKYPPTDAVVVAILRAEPTRPHVRLGEVQVEPRVKQSQEELEQALQDGAAQMGADAVVVVADPAKLLGGTAATSWWGRGVAPIEGEMIVAVAIRYLV